jgi:hypothetical protein
MILSMTTFSIKTLCTMNFSIMTIRIKKNVCDTQHNDILHNDTQHSDNQHTDPLHNDTQHNDTHHNDA